MLKFEYFVYNKVTKEYKSMETMPHEYTGLQGAFNCNACISSALILAVRCRALSCSPNDFPLLGCLLQSSSVNGIPIIDEPRLNKMLWIAPALTDTTNYS